MIARSQITLLCLLSGDNPINPGGVAEWLKAPVVKTGRDESPSWVRIPPPSVFSIALKSSCRLTLGDDLRQEPGSALGLVDPILYKAGGRDVVVIVANFMRARSSRVSC